ncbi:MAG TPA: DNA-protecting protein DprA [Deltaproteobacteria bacterium]|nr:DNA-protecting protein DprA [Deltaproteobacteria bacterium]
MIVVGHLFSFQKAYFGFNRFMDLNHPDLPYWLALNNREAIGPQSFIKAFDHFGSAKAVFGASKDDLIQCGLRPSVVSALERPVDLKQGEEELSFYQKKNIQILSFKDKAYPPLLKQIHSFPPLLFVWGNLSALSSDDCLGVVGSRAVTEYGVVACRRLVRECVEGGFSIVSGFAKGIDIEAHKTTLELGGITVAVLGSGFGFLYPPEHSVYVEKILEKGAFVSEFPFKAFPHPSFFPRRNRIISGLSRGVLVVEANEKSGAMITARYATEQNRDVFAVPGPLDSLRSRGCHRLIQQGAKLVMEGRDILDEWHYPLRSLAQDASLAQSRPHGLSRNLGDEKQKMKLSLVESNTDESKVVQACRERSQNIDEIIGATGLSSEKLTVLLTQLELGGRLRLMPGGRFLAV